MLLVSASKTGRVLVFSTKDSFQSTVQGVIQLPGLRELRLCFVPFSLFFTQPLPHFAVHCHLNLRGHFRASLQLFYTVFRILCHTAGGFHLT